MNTTKTYINHEKRLQILESMMLDLINKTDGQVIDILELRFWYARLQKQLDELKATIYKKEYIYTKKRGTRKVGTE